MLSGILGNKCASFIMGHWYFQIMSLSLDFFWSKKDISTESRMFSDEEGNISRNLYLGERKVCFCLKHTHVFWCVPEKMSGSNLPTGGSRASNSWLKLRDDNGHLDVSGFKELGHKSFIIPLKETAYQPTY